MYFRNRILRGLDASTHLTKPKTNIKAWKTYDEIKLSVNEAVVYKKPRSSEDFFWLELSLATSPLLTNFWRKLFDDEKRSLLLTLKQASHKSLFATQENINGKYMSAAIKENEEKILQDQIAKELVSEYQDKAKPNHIVESNTIALLNYCLEFNVTDKTVISSVEQFMKGVIAQEQLSTQTLLLYLRLLNRMITCHPSEGLVSQIVDVIKCLKRDFEANLKVIINSVLIDCLTNSEYFDQIRNASLLTREVSQLISDHFKTYCSPTSRRFIPEELLRLANIMLLSENARIQLRTPVYNSLKLELLAMMEAYWIYQFEEEEDREYNKQLFSAGTRILIQNDFGKKLLKAMAQSKLNEKKVERLITALGIYKDRCSEKELYDTENLKALYAIQIKLGQISKSLPAEAQTARKLFYIFLDLSIDIWEPITFS